MRSWWEESRPENTCSRDTAISNVIPVAQTYLPTSVHWWKSSLTFHQDSCLLFAYIAMFCNCCNRWWFFVPCFMYSLNLLIVDFLAHNTTPTNIMGNDTQELNNSAVLSNALKKKEKIFWPSYWRGKKGNLLKHHLKQEVPIHWNLAYYMLEQFPKQQNAVQDFVDQHKVRKSR